MKFISRVGIFVALFACLFSINIFAGNNEVLLAKKQAQIDAQTGPATGLSNDENLSENLAKKDKETDVVTYTFEGKNYKIKESLGTFKTTAYTPHCSGNITASGLKPSLNRTVSTDWSVIPKGSKLIIEGSDIVYVVEDNGVKNKTLDIFLATKKEARKYGVKYREVFILEEVE